MLALCTAFLYAMQSGMWHTAEDATSGIPHWLDLSPHRTAEIIIIIIFIFRK